MIYPAQAQQPRRTEAQRDGYVSFRVGDQWLGIPVVLVQEVLTHQEISPVPLAPREVSGFLNLRGQIVTAIDLRTRLGVAGESEDRYMNIVVWDRGELFSFLVDEVGDVVEVSSDRLEPTPATLDADWRACCDGVIRLERGLLAVLRVDSILHAVR
jgi:purine-binding chemotaxis protein CheW